MSQQDNKNRLIEGYERMLERVRGFVADLEHDTGPALHHAIDKARETATELGELTREEAERVAYYLRRDLEDAGQFLSQSGKDLGGWLQFDVELVERSLFELFLTVADRTKVELEQLHFEAEILGEWHTGEITGPGTLRCKSCGEELAFHGPSHIPPCPRCRSTVFRRIDFGG